MDKINKDKNIKSWRNRENQVEVKAFSKYQYKKMKPNAPKSNWRIPQKQPEKKTSTNPKDNSSQNDFNKEQGTHINGVSSDYSKININLLKASKSTSELTQEELKILNEEPLNTTNPLKAILGYAPKDEKEICKFSINGECFKKSKCHLKHEANISEGWTKDKVNVVISNCNEPTHPGSGTYFQVIPTFIEKSGYKFYGQVISPDLIKFYEFMSRINLPYELDKFHSYPENLVPTLAELVLAKYSDGVFYRAQITDYDEVTNSVVVFFVDYGNIDTVAMEDIRKWSRQLEVVSFQALHFTLDGIKCTKNQENELRIFLEKYILNKCFNAMVKNHFDSIYIKLLNNDMYDITDEFLQLGLCEIQNEPVYHFNNNIKIPG